MKKLVYGILGLLMAAPALASFRYELTVYNGSAMPLSPSAVYVRTGVETDRMIGLTPPKAFLGLCQSGNASGRVQELKKDMAITFLKEVPGMIMPGESRKIEVTVKHPQTQELHFETMYGKTKDVCGVIDVNSHSLYSLVAFHQGALRGRDSVVTTGAFQAPKLGEEPSYLCHGKNAVTCLRALSRPTIGLQKIRAFRPYLPSVINFLEDHYGADEVDTLLIPSSGAISFQLKKIH